MSIFWGQTSVRKKCCSQTDPSEEGSENEAIYSDEESETENIENGTSPLVDGMCTGMHSHFLGLIHFGKMCNMCVSGSGGG